MQKNCPNKARGAGRNGGGSHKGEAQEMVAIEDRIGFMGS
jgi:hypothetical protein